MYKNILVILLSCIFIASCGGNTDNNISGEIEVKEGEIEVKEVKKTFDSDEGNVGGGFGDAVNSESGR